ncbi:hypothetical protein [Sphingobacterium sp. N143]|nr:hypothetical protein [Sphingobacterium sp. N143]
MEITVVLAQFGLYDPKPLTIKDLMLGMGEEEEDRKCNIAFP